MFFLIYWIITFCWVLVFVEKLNIWLFVRLFDFGWLFIRIPLGLLFWKIPLLLKLCCCMLAKELELLEFGIVEVLLAGAAWLYNASIEFLSIFLFVSITVGLMTRPSKSKVVLLLLFDFWGLTVCWIELNVSSKRFTWGFTDEMFWL